MRVLVTDGDERPALAITRSLGRRGLSVLVGEERAPSLAASSRYCAGRVLYPSPYREPEAFQRFLADFAREERVDVVVPVTDVTTWAVCASQDALRGRAAAAVPPFAAFEAVTDKARLVESAKRCGIPVPRTRRVEGAAALRAAAAAVEYPAVVKPTRSRILTRGGWVGTRVHHVSGEGELRRLYEDTDYLAGHPSLIQERIAGPGLGVFTLFDRGELLAAFAHRRLREKPPSGGVSVLCESVPVDPRLRDEAARLLGPLRWHGVAMLEYKQDARTGEAFLLEVNGRFWGSLELAVHSGADFPYLACLLALERRPAAPFAYRVGVRNRWLLGDLDHLLMRLGRPARDLRLPAGAPSRTSVVADFLRCTAARVHDQVLSGDDPLPFLHELRRYARSLAGSAGRAALGRPPRAGVLPVARPSFPN